MIKNLIVNDEFDLIKYYDTFNDEHTKIPILDNDKKNCVICMEDFKNGDVTTNLPCLHMFHTNCIQSWLKTQNTCPICKFKLTQANNGVTLPKSVDSPKCPS